MPKQDFAKRLERRWKKRCIRQEALQMMRIRYRAGKEQHDRNLCTQRPGQGVQPTRRQPLYWLFIRL